MSEKIIQLYNSRRVGSTWLENLINTNFNDAQASATEKHNTIIRKDDVDGYVCMVRNPYAWINSMCDLHDWPKNQETLRYLAEQWCKDTKRYWDFCSENDDALFLRWDDYWQEPETLIRELESYFNIDASTPIKSVVGRSSRNDWYKYYYHQMYFVDLAEGLDVIKRRLLHSNNKKVLDLTGYDVYQ